MKKEFISPKMISIADDSNLYKSPFMPYAEQAKQEVLKRYSQKRLDALPPKMVEIACLEEAYKLLKSDHPEYQTDEALREMVINTLKKASLTING